NRVYPNPGDGFVFFVVFSECLNIGAVRLDCLMTYHTLTGRGNLLDITLLPELMTGVAFHASITVFFVVEKDRLLDVFGGVDLRFGPLTEQKCQRSPLKQANCDCGSDRNLLSIPTRLH